MEEKKARLEELKAKALEGLSGEEAMEMEALEKELAEPADEKPVEEPVEEKEPEVAPEEAKEE